MNACTRTFTVELTEADTARLGKENAELQIEISRLEFEKKKLSAKIKPLDERSDKIAHIIISGHEERDIECYWSYDWKKGIKTLHRSDTGEQIERDTIKDYERQPSLPMSNAVPRLFTNCPSCLYVKSGNPCAAALCGNPAMIHRSIPGPCDHPLESRVEESNVVTCGICNTVLDVAPITREMQAVELSETIAMEAPANVAEEAAFSRDHLPLDDEWTLPVGPVPEAA